MVNFHFYKYDLQISSLSYTVTGGNCRGSLGKKTLKQVLRGVIGSQRSNCHNGHTYVPVDERTDKVIHRGRFAHKKVGQTKNWQIE